MNLWNRELKGRTIKRLKKMRQMFANIDLRGDAEFVCLDL